MSDYARKPDHHHCLFDTASAQAGYFTNVQARACGFSRALLAYHARRGRFTRVLHGLYRLRDFPSSPLEEVVAAWMTFDSEVAVVSHESALNILGLSDLIPDTVHLTLLRSRRYRRAPLGLTLHTTDRPPGGDEIIVREGVRLTTAARAIVDAAEAGVDPQQIIAAARQSVRRGLATRAELLAAAQDRSRRIRALVRRALEPEAEEKER